MSDSQRHIALMLGIASLYEAADRAQVAPLQPSIELRALLALLHALTNGERRAYDGFWSEAMREGLACDHASAAGYIRGTRMRIEILGFARSLGLEPRSIEFSEAISGLRSKCRFGT